MARATIWTLAVLCLALPATARATTAQTIRLQGGSMWGVVIRRPDTGDLLVATPDGVQAISPRDLMTPPIISPAAARVDSLLQIVDDLVIEGRGGRLAARTGDLDKRINDFVDSVRTEMATSLTPEPAKRSIQVAIDWYRGVAARLPDTARLFQVAEEIAALRGQMQRRQRNPEVALLTTIVDLSRRMTSLGETDPRAAGVRATATEHLSWISTEALDALVSAALDEYRQRGRQDTSIDLLTALRTGEGVAAFEAAEAKLVRGLIAAVDARRQNLPNIVASLLRFRNNQLTLDLDSYSEGVGALRAAGLFADQLRTVLFGAPKAALRQEIQALTGRIDETVAASDKVRDQAFALRRDYTRAEGLLNDGNAAAAEALYAQLLGTIDASPLKEPTWRGYVEQRRRQALARQLIARMNDIDRLDADALEALAGDASAFFDKYEADFDALGLDKENFGGLLARLGNYRTFIRGIAVIEQQRLTERPLEAWKNMALMNTWLPAHAAAIPPAAVDRWRQYFAAHGIAVVRAACSALLDSGRGLQSDADYQTFESFIDQLLVAGQPQEAQALVERASARLTRGNGTARLAELRVRIARNYVENEQWEAAQAVIDALQRDLPLEAQPPALRQQLAEVVTRQARNDLAQGNTKTAQAIFTRLCRQHPDYAAANGLFQVLVHLELEQAQATVLDEKLAVLEDLAARFSGRIGNVPETEAARDQILADFNTQWRDTPRAALGHIFDLAEKFPTFTKETDLMGAVLRQIRRDLGSYLADETRLTPSEVLEALTVMLRRRTFREIARTEKLIDPYIELQLRRAKRFADTGQVDRAYQIYEALDFTFPALANAHKVQASMDELAWRRHMELIRRPLRITGMLDAVAAMLWPLLWVLLLARTIWMGLQQDQLRERLLNFGLCSATFILLVGLFLYGHVPHWQAAALGALLPVVLFHAAGMAGYRFFPLIYGPRRIALERGLLAVAGRLRAEGLIEALDKDVMRLEHEVPLLRDRRRFLVDRAERLAEHDPGAALRLFEQVAGQLDETDPDERDMVWHHLHDSCLFHRGILQHELGNEEVAIDLLRDYLKVNPQQLRARVVLGRLLFNHAQYEEAIPHLKVCLSTRSQDDDLWYMMGRSFFELGRYAGAHKFFSQVGERRREVLLYGARAFAHCGVRERAVSWFQQLLRDNPNDDEAVYYLACFFAQYGDDSKALKVVQSLTSDSAAFYPAGLTLQGNLLLRNGKLREARETFSQVLAMDAALETANLGLGQLEIQEGDRGAAMDAFQRVIDAHPEHPAANYFIGALLEKQEPDRAVTFLEHAVNSDEFGRPAAWRLGRIRFFKNDYEGAVASFAMAETAGESSPWYLFLYAYALATTERLDDCDRVLSRILGHAAPDPEWQRLAMNCIYALGVRLFMRHGVQLAARCFQYVSEHLGPSADRDRLEQLIEETLFRQGLDLVAAGETTEAQNVLAMLQLETAEQTRFDACQFYLAISQLFNGQHTQAEQMLHGLIEQDPQNSRYRYHQAIMELLGGDRATGQARVRQLKSRSDLAPRLRVGLAMVDAFLAAEGGDWGGAAAILDQAPVAADDGTETVCIRRKLLLTEVYYLCRLGDNTRINSLLKAHANDRFIGSAVNLYATALMLGGDTHEAYQILRAYARESSECLDLFERLSLHRAHQCIVDGEFAAARNMITSLPEIPRRLEKLPAALEMIDTLDIDLDDPDEVLEAIESIQDLREESTDLQLSHSMEHNLGVLQLAHAIGCEEVKPGIAERQQAWRRCLDYWEQHVLTDIDYWNLERRRFPGAGDEDFDRADIDTVTQRAADEALVRTMEGYIFSWLRRGDEEATDRHLQLFIQFTERHANAEARLSQLRESLETELAQVRRSDPEWDGWPQQISILRLRIEIGDRLHEDVQRLHAELTTARECRKHYERPSDYTRERRQFTTLVLEALQEGTMENYGAAASKLERVLRHVPPGLTLGDLEKRLRLLREGCRKPQESAEQGLNLPREFRQAYGRAKNFDFRR